MSCLAILGSLYSRTHLTCWATWVWPELFAYTAPEQLQGKPSFASDQESLAIMAYKVALWVATICG